MGVGAGGRRRGDTFVVVLVDVITINAGLEPHTLESRFQRVCVCGHFLLGINMLVVWFLLFAGWLVRTGG